MASRTVARTVAPALPSLPVLVARAAHDAGAASPSASAAGLPAAHGGAAIQRSAAAVRPIAAHNPLRPVLALQRDVDDDSDDADDDAGLPSPWWAPGGDGSTAQSRPLSGGADAGPAVQRSAFTAPSSASVPGVRAAANSASAARPNLQRSTNQPSTAARMPLAVAATPSASGASSGTPNWSAPGTTVVFPQRSITSDPTVQTSRAAGGPGSSNPTVQREGPTTPPTTAPTSPSPAPGPAPAKAAPSERDLDELAKQLFGRIRTRLRADLLHDREAAGFTFDNV